MSKCKNFEKKLGKDFKVYHAAKKEALTLFEKKTGLFKASIVRHETYPIPQFVYDLHIDNLTYKSAQTGQLVNTTICETYDTFDEAVAALLYKVC